MARGLRHEEHHAEGEEEGGEDLDAYGDFPGCYGLGAAGATDVVCAVANLLPCVKDASQTDGLGMLTQKLVMMPKVMASC